MSLLRTLDRTTCHNVSNTAFNPLFALLCPALYKKTSRRSSHYCSLTRPLQASSMPHKHMDNFFIHALARASTCQEHRRPICTHHDPANLTLKYYKTRRKCSPALKSFQSTKSSGPFGKVREFAKSELQALVDYYGITFETAPEEDLPEDGLLIWNTGNDHVPWCVKEEVHTEYIQKLEELLEAEESSHEDIFAYYKRLPAPGVIYLKLETIRLLLHRLSIVERANPTSMQRFLSILDDMKNAHIHIIRSEWTTGIYFAGRCLGKVSADEVQSALYLWRDMEKRAGVRGGAVTLNVLFDIAVKAGKYTLAETFLKEMEFRKLKFHRHFRVSLLYYHGVMQNGNAVRKTYQQLVEAGDTVDTVVMNAVIAALIRAGEPGAAEHVFERMKRLNATKTKVASRPRNWRVRRQLGLQLTWDAQKYKETLDISKRKGLQDSAPIAPDSRTYGLLIRHHASTTGNIDRVEELLSEMLYNSVPLEGTIFIVIIYGFNSFGGVRYSSWTHDRLERIWAEYLQSVEDGLARTWLSPMAIIASLKAFKKCTDSERTLRAWEEVRRIWTPKPEELEKVLKALRRLVPEGSFFDENV